MIKLSYSETNCLRITEVNVFNAENKTGDE